MITVSETLYLGAGNTIKHILQDDSVSHGTFAATELLSTVTRSILYLTTGSTTINVDTTTDPGAITLEASTGGVTYSLGDQTIPVGSYIGELITYDPVNVTVRWPKFRVDVVADLA